MNDLEERRHGWLVQTSRYGKIAAIAAGIAVATPSIQQILPLRFWASGGFSVGEGGGGGAVGPGEAAPSYDPPATPTASAVVLTDTSAYILGTSFSGDGDDTHDSTIFQATLLSQSGWGTLLVDKTTGAVERDTSYTYATDSVYKARLAYKGLNGGWSAFSDSATFTVSVAGVPTPAFVLDFEDFANNTAFKGASNLTHRCSPDFPTCTGDAGVDTELVSATTALGSTKAGRCYYAHRDSASVYGESDILCTIRWDISGGTNSAVNLIHGEFRHSNTAVGDATSWKHDGASGLHKTQFVNGTPSGTRLAEMKFGSDIIEAKYNNNAFLDSRNVSDPNYVWNGQWYEYCQLVIGNTSSGTYKLKVDTLLIASSTNRPYSGWNEVSTIELGVNSLPNPSPVGAVNAFMEWGRHEIYTDTTGVAAAYSVCDFSGDG